MTHVSDSTDEFIQYNTGVIFIIEYSDGTEERSVFVDTVHVTFSGIRIRISKSGAPTQSEVWFLSNFLRTI